jgi:anti-sigma regulatory factor (Ser/Thr protein kinase)
VIERSGERVTQQTPSSAATVELRFTALPAHVRTARLVAAAVARRSGVDEAALDEVRLAVGEACSRAVELHRRFCPVEPVLVTLSEHDDAFHVAVADRAPAPTDEGDALAALTSAADLDHDVLPAGVGLAVIGGLVDDVEVRTTPDGTTVRMSWPTKGDSHPA